MSSARAWVANAPVSAPPADSVIAPLFTVAVPALLNAAVKLDVPEPVCVTLAPDWLANTGPKLRVVVRVMVNDAPA